MRPCEALFFVELDGGLGGSRVRRRLRGGVPTPGSSPSSFDSSLRTPSPIRYAAPAYFTTLNASADDARIEQVVRWLAQAGFGGIHIDERDAAGEATAFLQARR